MAPMDQTQPEATWQDKEICHEKRDMRAWHGIWVSLGVLLWNTSNFMEYQHQRALCHYDRWRQKTNSNHVWRQRKENTSTVPNITLTNIPCPDWVMPLLYQSQISLTLVLWSLWSYPPTEILPPLLWQHPIQSKAHFHKACPKSPTRSPELYLVSSITLFLRPPMFPQGMHCFSCNKDWSPTGSITEVCS